MKIKNTILMVLTLVTILVTSSFAATKLNPPNGLNFNSLGSYLDSTVPGLLSENLPGIQIALIKNGKIFYEKGFGRADKAAATPVTTETIFQVASISKSVTAWAVLALAQQQKIKLDAPISAYIHRWALPASSWDANGVTIRNILAHRAGLSLGGYPGYKPGQRMPSIEESLSGDNGQFPDLSSPGPLKLIDAPGQNFSYSGGGYTLLELMIEEVTRQDFSEYIHKTVLAPAKMDSSSFDYSPAIEKRLAKAYSPSGDLLPNYLFVEKAAAGLYSNAGDLARLLNELYRIKSDPSYQSPLLSRQYAAYFYSENPDVTTGEDVFGYFRIKKDGVIKGVQHPGGNQGWKCFYAVEFSTGKGMVFLTNSDAGDEWVSSMIRLYESLID